MTRPCNHYKLLYVLHGSTEMKCVLLYVLHISTKIMTCPHNTLNIFICPLWIYTLSHIYHVFLYLLHKSTKNRKHLYSNHKFCMSYMDTPKFTLCFCMSYINLQKIWHVFILVMDLWIYRSLLWVFVCPTYIYENHDIYRDATFLIAL